MENLYIFRKIVEDKKKKNFIRAILLSIVSVLIIIFAIIITLKSYNVTNISYNYILLIPIIYVFTFFYSKKRIVSKLNHENLDSKDMSLVFDIDHPIALRAIEKVTGTGVYTYADLDHDLLGYEKIEAALNYAKTGKNKKFRINHPISKGNESNFNKKISNFIFRLIPSFILLLQLGVIVGIIPTISEVFFNQDIVSITLHHSIKDMTINNILPKAITIGIMQLIKVVIKKV